MLIRTALALLIITSVAFQESFAARKATIRMRPANGAKDGRVARMPVKGGRAMWVVRTSLLSRESIDRLIEQASGAGFNTLFVQVSGRGDAYFPSRVFPPAEDYAGRVAGAYDPLAYVLEKAHARRIEVHAWVNTLLVWSAPKPPRDNLHVVNAHPEWIMMNYSGERMTDYPFERYSKLRIEGAFRSLAEPESARDLEKFLLDLVSRYPVDGLHLDYIRYPADAVDYGPAARRQFAAMCGVDPLQLRTGREQLESRLGRAAVDSLSERWLAFKASLVTQFVETLRGHLNQVRPGMPLSAAVKPDIGQAYRTFAQDWTHWVRQGQLDFVVPMAYSSKPDMVYDQIEAACRAVGAGHVWAGIRAWDTTVPQVMERARRLETLGAGGISFFSYNGMENNRQFFQSVRAWMLGR